MKLSTQWIGRLLSIAVITSSAVRGAPQQHSKDSMYKVVSVRYCKFTVETHGYLTRAKLKSEGYDLTSLAKEKGYQLRALKPMKLSNARMDEGNMRLFVEFEDGYSYWIDREGNFDDGTICSQLGQEFEFLKFTLYEMIPPQPSVNPNYYHVSRKPPK